MSHHKIEFKQVQFTYKDGNRAVEDMTFSVGHGESIGIIGANGAGKSTLLKLLVGIMMPEKGEIHVGNLQLSKKTLPFVRREIGFTFQEADHQLFMNTVYDDVAFGPRNLGMEEDEVEKTVAHALETVGALHLKERASYRLSGGEKRNVAIATVLAMEPNILVMDEPTSGLDPKARRRLIELLKQFEHTKLIATHDLDMVLDLCDRVIVLHEGKCVRDGKTRELLEDAEFLESCSLEKPLSLTCWSGHEEIGG